MAGGAAPKGAGNRICGIILDERSVLRRRPEVEHERAVAIYDLVEENSFAPTEALCGDLVDGPFVLTLGLEEGRLRMELATEDGRHLPGLVLPLSPFRRIIKDYFLVCETYYSAIKSAPPSQIEAIDMGRRGLHNEGAELLRELLAEKVAIDRDTARRLFTLLCVLSLRG